ncbi:MAG: DUF3267 domain-containing protein [Methanomicrobia archaeon]|nr:DUF3267 domain-containing protein [Methanomicrobia archaeon]
MSATFSVESPEVFYYHELTTKPRTPIHSISSSFTIRKNGGNIVHIFTRLPPTDPERLGDLQNRGWVRLGEPKCALTALLVSLPLMAVTAALTLGIFTLFAAFSREDLGFAGPSFSLSFSISLPLVLGILAVLVCHELSHLLFIPNVLRSDSTGVGMTVLGAVVYTEEVLSRSRHLLISIAPFAIISVLVPIVLGIAGLLTPAFFVPILLNSLGSSVDLLIAMLVLTQVPAGASLVSNGRVTCWKEAGESG